MCERQTFSIDFIARKLKSNNTLANIYARVTVDGQTVEISTKDQIKHVLWDHRAEEVKGKGLETATINNHIDEVRFRLKQKYLELEHEKEIITAQVIKEAYLGVRLKSKRHTLLELTVYFEKIWTTKIEFKNYGTTIAYLKLFVKHQFSKDDIHLLDIDKQFATDFEYYIKTNPIKHYDKCEGNGLAKHIQRFKRILNWAADEIGWLPANPCDSYNCPLKKTKRKKLSIDEVIVIENKLLSNKKLEYVRDIFIFSCYTGLAFADVMALCSADFERTSSGIIMCKIYRAKSDELCAVPFLKKAISIMLKYSNTFESRNYTPIFPRITNQDTNRCLKIIAEICDIKIPLTFHVARHSFAKAIALKNGIPLETVQIMLGHTKITTTQIYADVDEEKILQDISGMEEKIEMRKTLLLNSSNAIGVS